MKTILVPTQNIPAMKSTLETAVLLAQRTGAYVEGVPLWYGVPEFVVAEQASSFSIETYRARRHEETAGMRKLFETFMQEHGIAAARTIADLPSFGWFAEVPPGEDLVGSYGRAFDVIVMSRPDADTAAPYNRAIESALFESGRPVLLSPPTAPKQIATNTMIHWNSSTEQARPQRVSVPARTGWTLITSGARHTCATHTGHALFCWGLNSHGELGLGSTTDQNLPQQVTA